MAALPIHNAKHGERGPRFVQPLTKAGSFARCRSRASCCSHRTFIARLRRAIGMTPKVYPRVMRVTALLKRCNDAQRLALPASKAALARMLRSTSLMTPQTRGTGGGPTPRSGSGPRSRVHELLPYLNVADGRAAIAFCQEVFGANELSGYASPAAAWVMPLLGAGERTRRKAVHRTLCSASSACGLGKGNRVRTVPVQQSRAQRRARFARRWKCSPKAAHNDVPVAV